MGELFVKGENNVQEYIEPIGRLSFLAAIIFGENLQIKELVNYTYNAEGEQIKHPQQGDFFVTISRKTVILTHSLNGKRTPLVCKRWNKVPNRKLDQLLCSLGDSTGRKVSVKTFLDSEGMLWTYRNHSEEGISLTVNGGENNFVICEMYI